MRTTGSEPNAFALRLALAAAALGLLAGAGPPPSSAAPAPDYEWTFGAVGLSDYRLTAVSSPDVYGGALDALDPALNLILDKRYRIEVIDFIAHPIQIVAKAANALSDGVLLAMGPVAGSMEADAGVAWTDNGAGTVEFTLTSALLAAARSSARAPGYRCAVHSDSMRGDFVIFGDGAPIANPIPDPIPKGPETVEVALVVQGLVSPLGFLDPDDGTGRFFVYDQTGVATVLLDTGAAKTFLDLRSRLVALNAGYDERGLLGFALHPDFAANGKVYTYTSEPVAGPADFTTNPSAGVHNHQSVIAEWQTAAADPDAIDPATRRELMRIDQPQGNHNGGDIRFGPDNLLYIALGDGGSGDDQGAGHGPAGNGQNKDVVYGKILRIDVGGADSANGQYGIPPGNPFVGAAGVDEIYAWGFRNPYRISFDQTTGELWAGDVGQSAIEEIDRVAIGGNYGWRAKEGSFHFDPNGAAGGFVTDIPPLPPPPDLIDPVAQYDHGEGTAVVGGFVSRGPAALSGFYVAGDLGPNLSSPSGRLFYVNIATGELREAIVGANDRPLGFWIKGFGQDAAGNVYICGSKTLGPSGATGAVLKIVPLAAADNRRWVRYE